VTGYAAGSVDVYIANLMVGTITANGTFRYYGTPTATGVVSFNPSTDFIGCLSGFDLRELKNSHTIDLVAMDDLTHYDVSGYLSYWEDKVTLILPINNMELEHECYYLEAYDACQVDFGELVTDGDFGAGDLTDWTVYNEPPFPPPYQYLVVGNELEFIFEPLEGANQLTNGDFATGDFTGWTAGAGWSVVANKAVHTPGSTATLSQSVTIGPVDPWPSIQMSWWQLVMSGWTTGTITVTLSDKTSATYGVNDTITARLAPTVGGVVTFTITPSSTFDGTIDDIKLHETDKMWGALLTAYNTVNPNFVDGNYQLSYEITASTVSANNQAGVAMGIEGMAQAIVYNDTVAVHTPTVTGYSPGGQRAYLQVQFRTGNNWYPGVYTVDNVSAIRVEPFEATYTSECLNYQTSHLRTKILTAYCDQESFGFEFVNTGFVLQQRALIRSLAPMAKKEKQIAKFGTGDGAVVYASDEKFWQLHTGFASETFHDALAIMVDCDHFAIGETAATVVEYLAEVDDYNPSWVQSGAYSLAPAVISIRVKEGGQKFNRHT